MDTQTVPAAALKQAEEAERLQKGLQGNPPAAAGEETPPQEGAGGEEGKTVESAPVTTPPAPPQEPPAAEGTPAPSDTVPRAEHANLQAENERLKEAYSTLQGKYDAEVPRLHQDMADLKARFETLQGAEHKKEEEQQEQKINKILESMKADLGEDTLEQFRALIRHELGLQIAPVTDRVEGVAQTVTMSAQDRYMRDLDSLAPNWRKQVRNPAFIEWANTPDPLYGRKPIDDMEAARDRYDSDRVAAFYNAFDKTAGGNGQGANPQTTTPTPSKEDFVAPDGSRKGDTDGGGQEDIITSRDVSVHYDKVKRGLYASEEDSNAMERRILKAQAAGSIVNLSGG